MDSLNDTEEILSEKTPSLTGTVEGMRKLYSGHLSEQKLADAYVIADNTFWLIEDDIYDYDEGTSGYYAAKENFDNWLALALEYKNKIIDILRSEGITVPETGQIKILIPFMKRNGYIYGGWWYKPEVLDNLMQNKRCVI